MAKIKVSAQEIKKGLPLEAKWYGATIKEMKIEPTKDKTGLNNNLTIVVDDGTPEGREITGNVFKADLKAVWEAALSTEENRFEIPLDGSYEFDTDDIAGKHINVRVENEIYQGRPVPKVKGYIPGHIDVSTIPF